MKAIFTYTYGEGLMAEVEKLGYEVIYAPEKTIEYIDDYKDVEVLVCYDPFKTLDIKKMKNLKYIQLSSIGIDQVPDDYDENILFGNNHGGYSVPIGEWTVFKMLEIFKNGRYFHEKQKEKHWKLNSKILEMKDKKVAFVGTGTLAGESAKRLQGFDMDITGFSQSGTQKEFFDQVYTIDKFEELIGTFDVIVLAIPHTAETHHFMNEKYLKLMKDNSVLINISRGKVLDEKALIENHEKFLGIALDVFEVEPLEKTNPLWELENVYISPHNSWISEMRNQRRFEMIYENMRRYINSEPILHQIDPKRGY